MYELIDQEHKKRLNPKNMRLFFNTNIHKITVIPVQILSTFNLPL